ncbi:MAG: hypothetical protein HY741_06705 [Chloroflexi bacterium]|nr:hypothetical protein [Chloroflexota bacterium]
MTIPLPSRQTLVALLANVWAILVGGVRVFAWDSLQSGFIDVRPLPRVARLLAITGLVIVFVLIGSILFNDPLRWSGGLENLPLSSSATRGVFVPAPAVPIAYFVTILAWSFVFTGALHTLAVVRWGAFFCFFFFGFSSSFLGMLQVAATGNVMALLVSVGMTAAVLVVLVLALLVLPRVHAPLFVEFIWILAGVGGLFLISLNASAQASQLGSIDFVSGYLVPEVTTSPRNLIAPFLYLAGAEMVNFGISLTSWGARATEQYGKRQVIVTLLIALLGYRWLDFVVNTLLPGVSQDQVLAWMGALLAGSALIPIAVWRMRQSLQDRLPLKLIVALILGIIVPQLVLLVGITLSTAFFSTQTQDPNVLNTLETVSRPLLALSAFFREYTYIGLAIAGVGIAFFAARAKRFTVAAFGMILAWTQFVWWFMENGRPLQDWRYHYQDLDEWLVLALTVVTLYLLARKQLTQTRALALLGLAFFGWVLNFTDFLDNPLSLFFGFAGIFFTAFGILWNVVTAGGRFANFDSPTFPRLSRIVLYLGYVLLTVNVTHWFTVTHNVEEQVFNTDLTLVGLRIFGLTAAYLVFVEGGRALTRE